MGVIYLTFFLKTSTNVDITLYTDLFTNIYSTVNKKFNEVRSLKSVDCIIIEEYFFSEFSYRLYEKAYDINNSKHCHVRDVSWDVVVLEDKTVYSAIISYTKDSEDAEIKPCSFVSYSKEAVWFDAVLGYSKEDFEETLKYKISDLNNTLHKYIKDITHHVINVNNEAQYIAVITSFEKY